MRHLVPLATAIAVALATCPAWSAQIEYGFGYLNLWAGDSTADLDRIYIPPDFLSTSRSESNSVNGARAEATYLLSQNQISVSYDLLRPPHQDGPTLGGLELATAEGRVDFTVDELVEFALDARISALDPEGRNTTLWVQLFENDVRIFDSFQLSDSTPNQEFFLGGSDGDVRSSLSGDLTGTLIPGYRYRYEYYARIVDVPSPSLQEATASGYFSLRLIPEPGTAILLGLGLAWLGALRVRD